MMKYRKVCRPISKRNPIKRRSNLVYRGNATYLGESVTFPDEKRIVNGYSYNVRIRESGDTAVVFAYDGGQDRLFTLVYEEEEWAM